MLKTDTQQHVWETHARWAWNSHIGNEAVKEAAEKRNMLMEDPLEQKNYPNLVWVERRNRLAKISLADSSLGKRKSN